MSSRAPFFNQSRFPRLWLLFQHAIGGAADKARLMTDLYRGERAVLEVGCSVGHLADAFRSVSGVDYHGLDIDESAVRMAQRRFAGQPAFRFTCGSVESLAAVSARYDLVYIAGVLHHVPDDELRALVTGACVLLRGPEARVCVIEPLAADTGDPWLVRGYANHLEQGEHLRTAAALETLVTSAAGLDLRSRAIVPVRATPFGWPLCARFLVLELGAPAAA